MLKNQIEIYHLERILLLVSELSRFADLYDNTATLHKIRIVNGFDAARICVHCNNEIGRISAQLADICEFVPLEPLK